MKITFKADSLPEILAQMTQFIDFADAPRADGYGVEISSLAPAPEDATVPLEDLMTGFEDEAEAKADAEDAKVPSKRGRKPKAAVVPDEPVVPAVPPETMMKEAVSKLMVLYNTGGEAQKAVKALLVKYGVSKFSAIPVEQAQALLTDAEAIEVA